MNTHTYRPRRKRFSPTLLPSSIDEATKALGRAQFSIGHAEENLARHEDQLKADEVTRGLMRLRKEEAFLIAWLEENHANGGSTSITRKKETIRSLLTELRTVKFHFTEAERQLIACFERGEEQATNDRGNILKEVCALFLALHNQDFVLGQNELEALRH